MKTDRLNAFTDGVLAIVITIMVLELPVPEGHDLASLTHVMPLFGAYLLSFVNVGIFWSNHHHMLQAAGRVDGRVLWANHALLFPLTLIPFVIRWIGERGVTAWPVAAYGLVLIAASVGYLILERALIGAEGDESRIKAAVGSRQKEWISAIGYSSGAALAFIAPYLSVAIYAAISAMWLVPDRRFEPRG